MGIPIPLEHCRMAETIKNDPGQWKFIGIEGVYSNIVLSPVYKHLKPLVSLIFNSNILV